MGERRERGVGGRESAASDGDGVSIDGGAVRDGSNRRVFGAVAMLNETGGMAAGVGGAGIEAGGVLDGAGAKSVLVDAVCLVASIVQDGATEKFST